MNKKELTRTRLKFQQFTISLVSSSVRRGQTQFRPLTLTPFATNLFPSGPIISGPLTVKAECPPIDPLAAIPALVGAGVGVGKSAPTRWKINCPKTLGF